MRILNTRQIRALDAYTIANEPIASIELMERASRSFVEWFTLQIAPTKKIGVVCGTGNNGGDGLAIARMLHEWGYNVRVWVVSGGAPSEDFSTNRARLPEKIECVEIRDERDNVAFESCDALIDAIFGSGLSRPPSGIYARVIELMNQAEAVRVAVDIPSGLMADAPSAGPIVKAHYTVTFQLPKLAFFFPGSFEFTGEWVVVDIGLDKEYIRNAETDFFYTRRGAVRRMLKSRSKFDHKGTFGHALLITGSYGKMGAAVLAARAALRSGLGLLTVHVPQCGYQILQTAVPEAMCQVDSDAEIFTGPPDVTLYDVLGIGPGLGQDKRTAKALEKALAEFGRPVVLDADALNLLARERELLKEVPPSSILTPHPREFERLAGPWTDDFQRLEIQRQLSVSLRAVVVLKGAYTSITADDGKVYFNSTGNPGMATGGTGDVLTGIITGLLAQKYSPLEAAVAGVFLHGYAGDLAAQALGMASILASDVIDQLPSAFLNVMRK